MALPGEDIPEYVLLFGWRGIPTAEDLRWADEKIKEMEAMDTRVFQVDADQLAELEAFLAGHGITFTLPAGESKEKGWDISWSMDNGSLTVNVIQHPFAEEGALWAKIENLLKAP